MHILFEWIKRSVAFVKFSLWCYSDNKRFDFASLHAVRNLINAKMFLRVWSWLRMAFMRLNFYYVPVCIFTASHVQYYKYYLASIELLFFKLWSGIQVNFSSVIIEFCQFSRSIAFNLQTKPAQSIWDSYQ